MPKLELFIKRSSKQISVFLFCFGFCLFSFSFFEGAHKKAYCIAKESIHLLYWIC